MVPTSKKEPRRALERAVASATRPRRSSRTATATKTQKRTAANLASNYDGVAPTAKRSKLHHHRLCSVKGCVQRQKVRGLCREHGGSTICRHEGCTLQIKNNGVCYRHGARKWICKHDTCNNLAVQQGRCIKHGAKRECDVNGCTNHAQQGGRCYSHGAIIPICRHKGCTTKMRVRGFCFRHLPKDKQCGFLGCENINLRASGRCPKCVKLIRLHGEDNVAAVLQEEMKKSGPRCNYAGGCANKAVRHKKCRRHEEEWRLNRLKPDGNIESLELDGDGVAPENQQARTKAILRAVRKCTKGKSIYYRQGDGDGDGDDTIVPDKILLRRGHNFSLADTAKNSNNNHSRRKSNSEDECNDQRQCVKVGMPVKVRLKDNKWHNGKVDGAVDFGATIRVHLDDGVSEVFSFPDDNIVIDTQRDDLSGRDEEDGTKSCPTERPTREILTWVRSMSEAEQRKCVKAGMRVKVRFHDNKWYGGMIDGVVDRGHTIRIHFDDGTRETTSFPENDIIVDAQNNGKHRNDAWAFSPLCSEIGQNVKDKERNDLVNTLANNAPQPSSIKLAQGTAKNNAEDEPDEEEELGALIYKSSQTAKYFNAADTCTGASNANHASASCESIPSIEEFSCMSDADKLAAYKALHTRYVSSRCSDETDSGHR